MSSYFIQITDTHIRAPGQLAYRKLDTASYLQRTVQKILRHPEFPHPAQAVVMTGDLTDFGRVQEYEHLRAILAPLDMPVYLLPGNHDHRERLRDVFADHQYLGDGPFIQYTADMGKIRLIALDTTTPGASHGELCESRLQWLSDALAQSADLPVVLAMHHPPFRTGIEHMDQQNLLVGRQALARIVRRYDNIEHILCGHVHRPVSVRFAGTLASIAPSTAHQVTLDLSAQGPSSWTLEPASYRIFQWIEDQGLVSHLACVGDFDGPHPFYENGELID